MNPFRDLDGVGRGAFAKVIADDPEGESIRAGEVFADSSDIDFIGIMAIGRHRIDLIWKVINDFDARHRSEEFAGFFDGNLLFGFDADAFAMAVGDRNANGGRADHNGIVAQDFARLIEELQFFGRIALFLHTSDLRNAVEGDSIGEGFVLIFFPFEIGAGSVDEVAVSGETGAAGRLISADDNALNLAEIVKRL